MEKKNISTDESAKLELQELMFKKAVRTDVNYVFEGDSRIAGGSTTDWPYKLQSLSNFANTGNFYNVAAAGERIWQITASYATEVFPKRPTGSIIESFLFVEIGINDLADAAPDYTALASDLLTYCNTAKTDGFKVVLIPPFYRSDFTRTQELARLKFNDLLRQGKSNYYMLVDLEQIFPPTSSNIFYSDVVHLTELGNVLVANYINFLFSLSNVGANLLFRSLMQDVFTPYTEQKIDGSLKVTGKTLLKGIIDQYTFTMLSMEAPNAATAKWDILVASDGTLNITQGGGYVNRFKIDGAGNVNFSGKCLATQHNLTALNAAPSTSTSTGTLGEVRIASDYIYVCIATNTWVRSALATW